MGRSTRKPRKTTRKNAARATTVRRVTRGLRRSITTNARVAVRSPPASSTSPVPTRFRNPSTSFMTRETRSPVLFWSSKATGRRPTCSCTRTRISAMSFCAAFDTSWTSANELRPCSAVAPTTAPTRGRSRSSWRRPMTSSIRYLVEAGRTSPATRLIAMSTKASASSRRRGFMRAQTSGQKGPEALRLAAPGRLPRQPGHDPGGSLHRGILPRPGPGPGRRSGRSNSRATRRLRRPSPLGLAGLAELLDDPPQVVGPAAVQAGDDRAIEPVQELLPAAAADQKGDEVAGRLDGAVASSRPRDTQAAYRVIRC